MIDSYYFRKRIKAILHESQVQTRRRIYIAPAHVGKRVND